MKVKTIKNQVTNIAKITVVLQGHGVLCGHLVVQYNDFVLGFSLNGIFMTIVEQMIYRGCKLLRNCHWQKTAAAAVGNIGIPAMIHLEIIMKHNLRRSVHRYL